MRWVDSEVKLLTENTSDILTAVEYACRTCYRSHDKTGADTAEKLIRSCIKNGHESILEHSSLRFEVVCDRGILAEFTRHRHASFSVESTRYCNYSKDKFGSQLSFVIPHDEEFAAIVTPLLVNIEDTYNSLVNMGYATDLVRGILPNLLRTQMVVTMNLRAIRHFLKVRGTKFAHPGIRKIAAAIKSIMIEKGLGVFVEDIEVAE